MAALVASCFCIGFIGEYCCLAKIGVNIFALQKFIFTTYVRLESGNAVFRNDNFPSKLPGGAASTMEPL